MEGGIIMKRRGTMLGVIVGIFLSVISLIATAVVLARKIWLDYSQKQRIRDAVMDIFRETINREDRHSWSGCGGYTSYDDWAHSFSSCSGCRREDDEDWDPYETDNPSRDGVRIEED